MKKFVILIPVLATIWLSLSVVPAFAGTYIKSDGAIIDQELKDDTALAGQSLVIKAPVGGELVVAGTDITINSKPARSLLAGGNDIKIENGAGYNAFVAGTTVSLKGEFGHDVYVFGTVVELDESTVIKGSLYISGAKINIKGKVDGDVIVFGGGQVLSSAEIGRSLKGEAQSFEFTGGKIGKDFDYKSSQDAHGLDQVVITGVTKRQPIDPSPTVDVRKIVFGILSSLVVGAALLFFSSKKVSDVVSGVQTNWGKSWLWGAGVLILGPVILALIGSTIIGMPITLIGFALYCILVYLATIIGLIVIGRLILTRVVKTPTNYWLALLVGTLIIAVSRLIPTFGAYFSFLLFIGVTLPVLGALTQWWRTKLAE